MRISKRQRKELVKLLHACLGAEYETGFLVGRQDFPAVRRAKARISRGASLPRLLSLLEISEDEWWADKGDEP